jgi:hypothetical protein
MNVWEETRWGDDLWMILLKTSDLVGVHACVIFVSLLSLSIDLVHNLR